MIEGANRHSGKKFPTMNKIASLLTLITLPNRVAFGIGMHSQAGAWERVISSGICHCERSEAISLIALRLLRC